MYLLLSKFLYLHVCIVQLHIFLTYNLIMYLFQILPIVKFHKRGENVRDTPLQTCECTCTCTCTRPLFNYMLRRPVKYKRRLT